ncbi:MAG: bifunctional nicotinamidase/pyrazinamidase [Candidatus Riflebacteria bacterium]
MKALILVDLQNDFMPGGALAVNEGDLVVEPANRLAEKFELVVATQDWHPADHGSFASNHSGRQPGEMAKLDGLDQILWPNHCVQNTTGAEFHPKLQQKLITKVFRKGTNPKVDSYSGFYDNQRRQATGLGDWLREKQVKKVYVMGLATDYCVKFTALDAASEGFNTWLVTDGCRGVNLQPGDVEKALAEMQKAGVKLIESKEIESAKA